MNKTLIDAYEENRKLTGQEGYLELAAQAPKVKDNSYWGAVKDYGKTILKGAVEGISRLGQAMGPTFEVPTFEDGQLKLPRSNKQALEEQTESLNELLPTDEGFGQKALRRGLREAPSMMAFPGAGAQAGTRSLLAGAAGQTAEELGAPEWAQAAAELTAFIGPDITKKLISSGKDAELIAFAKKMGMTDEQITPLIQSEFKQKWLTKLSPKRGSTKKALENTKSSLGDVYSNIGNSEAAAKEITEQANGKLINELYSKLEQMPRDVQSKIEKDLSDLLENKITGKTLMNFYRDVNSHLSGNTKQLSLLKEPIKEAIGTLSPELAKDFESVNKLYSKYFPIAERLKPTLASDIISAAEAIGLLGGITLGYTPSIVGFLGEKAAKKVAQQMLINPHLQQLSKKMVDAMNANKYGIVKKLSDAFADQLKDTSPEASKALHALSEEEIKEFLNSRQKIDGTAKVQ